MSTPRLHVAGLTVGGIGPLNCTLAAGECVTLSGPSGAGKTRLLRAIADLDAHSGECRLDGQAAPAYDAPDWRRRVAFLAAESAWWTDTARAHFADRELPDADRLAALDLTPALLDRDLARLSSGQRQRLALLRLIAGDPAVLLLDEPTASLDGANIVRVERLIAEYRRENGACVVWVSHDAAQRGRVADRHLAVAAGGRVQPCT